MLAVDFGWFTDFHPIKFGEGLLLLVFCLVMARLLPAGLRRALRSTDPQVSILCRRLTAIGLIVLGVLGFFSVWTDSAAVVFGSFGVFALAFGLAFQDILKNFIAGVFLLLERPFRLGDEITVDAQTGVVENIEIRTTTLRTRDGEEVLVPNSLVFTGSIVNRTRYPTRQYTLTAKVPAGAQLDGLTEQVRQRLKSSETIAAEPPPHVGLQPSIDGGVTLEVRYWLDYRRHDPLQVQADLGRQIYQAIQSGSGSTPGRSNRGGKGGQVS
jgi:small-conductance mechanosensitive channel